MSEVPRVPRQIGVLVLRADKPQQRSFRWELREYGRGIAFRSGEKLYASQADARLAGEKALETFRAE